MLKTVTATYASQTTISNVVDELINAGIPREKIYDDGAPLYDSVLKETGTAIPVETLGLDGAIAEAGFQKLLELEVNDLKAMANEAGVKFAKTTTKAVLVKRLRDAAKAEA